MTPGRRRSLDRRYQRRARRAVRAHVVLLSLAAALLALGGVVVLAGLLAMVAGVVWMLLLGALAFRLLRAWRRAVRRRRGEAGRRRVEPLAEPPERRWTLARQRFARLRAEYAGYECDPLAVLRLPALADVTVPATARFVDAFAEAQALDTDQRPAPEFAARYVAAVDRAYRSWRAAREAAERIRMSGLSPEERARVHRVIKLLTMARDSGHDAERAAAYVRAREELARLDRAGAVRLPRLAQAALDEGARSRLPA